MATLLPAPVLLVQPYPSSSHIALALQQLGYQADMLFYADDFSAVSSIEQYLPNLVLYEIYEAARFDDLHAIQVRLQIPHFIAVLPSDSFALMDAFLLSGLARYLISSQPVSKIVASLKIILRGGADLHPELAEYLLKQQKKITMLNPTEIQILQYFSQDTALSEIQNRLHLYDYQIYASIRSIFQKLAHPVIHSPN